VPGDKLLIRIAAKGGGSENMSRVTVLKPSQGIEGIKEFVRERVRESGGNPCPPIIVGVGIGGTIERCALLAKKALFRQLGQFSTDPDVMQLELDLIQEINNTGIGPMGYGGRVTALAVHVNAEPCHIASLPVAINLNCHSHRHREVKL
jgi:fumarate hydratase subunit alpha